MKTINDEKCKDTDGDTSGNLMELVHHIDGCEDMTEIEIFTWISSDIERDLTDQEIINIATKKEEDKSSYREDDDPNSTQEHLVTPEEVFKELEVSYVNLY